MASATASVRSFAIAQCLTNSAPYLDGLFASSAAKAVNAKRVEMTSETNSFMDQILLEFRLRTIHCSKPGRFGYSEGLTGMFHFGEQTLNQFRSGKSAGAGDALSRPQRQISGQSLFRCCRAHR